MQRRRLAAGSARSATWPSSSTGGSRRKGRADPRGGRVIDADADIHSIMRRNIDEAAQQGRTHKRRRGRGRRSSGQVQARGAGKGLMVAWRRRAPLAGAVVAFVVYLKVRF